MVDDDRPIQLEDYLSIVYSWYDYNSGVKLLSDKKIREKESLLIDSFDLNSSRTSGFIPVFI